MNQTLVLLMAAVTLFGSAIGLRFNVYIMVPAGLAVLMVSLMAQAVSNKAAEWGIPGSIVLLLLLNAGFILGLLLRSGAAHWSKRKIAGLFVRSGSLDQEARRPDGAGREASSEGPTAAITPGDLAKESFRR